MRSGPAWIMTQFLCFLRVIIMICYCQWTVRRLAVVSGLLLSVSTLAWGAPSPAAPLKVAATIFPLYDLVRQVAGPAVKVVLLVPRGAGPHTVTVKQGTVRVVTG